MTDETIRCPWCAEEILAAAKKCKHCGEFLTDDQPGAVPAAPAVASAGASGAVTPAARSHRCPKCSGFFPTQRELYLHDANVHRSATATTGAGTRSGSSAMKCPHCETVGRVTTRQVKVKKGISGGKATAAVLTAGFSMLGTGLSRKEKVTEARCGKCKAVWHF